MSWNYRVIKKVKRDEECYGIYEVFYNDDGEIELVSVDPAPVTGRSLQEMQDTFEKMVEAARKPILDYDQIQFVSTDLVPDDGC